ncbi:MAG: pimeloyl-ACP methyl ester carboxylesterase, partial [Myxococcota bacterium]
PAPAPAPTTAPVPAHTPAAAAPDAPEVVAGEAPERGKGKGKARQRQQGGSDSPLERTDWVTNPTSNAKLAAFAVSPVGEGPFPAIVIVPGGTKEGSRALRPPEWAAFVAAGFAVVTFDPDGRGESDGEEGRNGFAQQDGLSAIIDWAAARPEINGEQIGVLSLSYGVTMAMGALTRHETPAKFLIDWEGPANRSFTAGCGGRELRGGGGGVTEGISCEDEAFWSEREASSMVGALTVPYLRVQFTEDHAQPDAQSSLAMIHAARAGSVPWSSVNDEAPDKAIDALDDFATHPDPRKRTDILVRYAAAMMEQTTGAAVIPGEVPESLQIEGRGGGDGGSKGKGKGKGKRKQR